VEIVSFPPEVATPAWYWGAGRSLTWGRQGEAPTTLHQLLDVSKMQRELGYSDPVDYQTAMERTTAWYLENRPEPGGEEERQIGDPFDYAAEDAFLAAHADFAKACREIPFGGVAYDHPYAHPKAPDEEPTPAGH
jgi:hypothetical protein